MTSPPSRRTMSRDVTSDPSACPLIGRWRIFESDTWEADYLDMLDPASMTIGADGTGEFGFGVVTCEMDVGYAGDVIAFTFRGSSEGDEIGGSGSAELGEDGHLAIELSFHLGDDAVMKARRA